MLCGWADCTELTAAVFLKCDFLNKSLFGTSRALLNRPEFCLMSLVLMPYQTEFACELTKYSSLIKEIRLHYLVMECIEMTVCWPHPTPTVTCTWLYTQYKVVFLSTGNFTLTCKAQSAAAWECGDIQAWVISKHTVLTVGSGTIKRGLVCGADMKAYRNSPQLWKNMWTP